MKSEWFQWTTPKSLLKWKQRKEHLRVKLKEEIQADVFCLQEVDEFESEWKEFIENEMNMGVFISRGRRNRTRKETGVWCVGIKKSLSC